jgi:hypothetical protein
VVSVITRRPPSPITIEAMVEQLPARETSTIASGLVDAIGRGLTISPIARPALERVAARDGALASRARALLGG